MIPVADHTHVKVRVWYASGIIRTRWVDPRFVLEYAARLARTPDVRRIVSEETVRSNPSWSWTWTR